MQQYNYPKLIWMKQNVSFACSNYRSNWQLIDNLFALEWTEPYQNSEKKIRDHWTAMHRIFGESFHLYWVSRILRLEPQENSIVSEFYGPLVLSSIL